MTTRPAAEMRRKVVERAGHCCEYCLLHQGLVASLHQVDHVIAEKHGGNTTLENLALSCTLCNRRKGSDLSSMAVLPHRPLDQLHSESKPLSSAIVGQPPLGAAAAG